MYMIGVVLMLYKSGLRKRIFFSIDSFPFLFIIEFSRYSSFLSDIRGASTLRQSVNCIFDLVRPKPPDNYESTRKPTLKKGSNRSPECNRFFNVHLRKKWAAKMFVFMNKIKFICSFKRIYI